MDQQVCFFLIRTLFSFKKHVEMREKNRLVDPYLYFDPVIKSTFLYIY